MPSGHDDRGDDHRDNTHDQSASTQSVHDDRLRLSIDRYAPRRNLDAAGHVRGVPPVRLNLGGTLRCENPLISNSSRENSAPQT